MIELNYDSFEASGVQEQANRYDARGEVLHGPIPNARNTIAVTEVVFSFPRQLPAVSDLSLPSPTGEASYSTDISVHLLKNANLL